MAQNWASHLPCLETLDHSLIWYCDSILGQYPCELAGRAWKGCVSYAYSSYAHKMLLLGLVQVHDIPNSLQNSTVLQNISWVYFFGCAPALYTDVSHQTDVPSLVRSEIVTPSPIRPVDLYANVARNQVPCCRHEQPFSVGQVDVWDVAQFVRRSTVLLYFQWIIESTQGDGTQLCFLLRSTTCLFAWEQGDSQFWSTLRSTKSSDGTRE